MCKKRTLQNESEMSKNLPLKHVKTFHVF